MDRTKRNGIWVVFVILVLMLTVNPAISQVKNDEAAKANETLASMTQVNINEADAGTLATLCHLIFPSPPRQGISIVSQFLDRLLVRLLVAPSA